MRISFITINRFVEDRAASDETYRRELERRGKVLLSHGRALPDEALLAKLRTVGLLVDKPQFLAMAQGFLSAQEMAMAVYKQPGLRIREIDQDWVWIAFTCLWERWLRQRPSLEMIDDWMQEGYQKLARGDAPGTCHLWLAAWKSIWTIMEAQHLRTLEEFDALFCGTSSLFNWVQDLVQELHNAGLTDRSFFRERITLLETLLGRLQLDDLLLANFRSDLAQTYFAVGEPEKGEQLYRQWLHEEPQWGWGWIGWSDCYFTFALGREKDPARAETILKQGLAVAGVKDKPYLLDRLAGLYAETGRADEAQAIREEIPKAEPPTINVATEAPRERLSIQETSTFGGQGLLREAVERLAESLRGKTMRSATANTKIGRNDPCPCGSGKKFKRCCGRKVT